MLGLQAASLSVLPPPLGFALEPLPLRQVRSVGRERHLVRATAEDQVALTVKGLGGHFCMRERMLFRGVRTRAYPVQCCPPCLAAALQGFRQGVLFPTPLERLLGFSGLLGRPTPPEAVQARHGPPMAWAPHRGHVSRPACFVAGGNGCFANLCFVVVWSL